MTHRHTHQPPKSDDAMTITRRRFLQGGLAAAATAAMAFPHDSSEAKTAHPNPRKVLRRPNFLIFLCDEMRFPPVYESDYTKQFR